MCLLRHRQLDNIIHVFLRVNDIRVALGKRHDLLALGLRLDHLPDRFGQVHIIGWFFVHLSDEVGTLLSVAGFPVCFLAGDGAVVDDSAAGAAGEGDVFVGGFLVAALADVGVHFAQPSKCVASRVYLDRVVKKGEERGCDKGYIERTNKKSTGGWGARSKQVNQRN